MFVRLLRVWSSSRHHHTRARAANFSYLCDGTPECVYLCSFFFSCCHPPQRECLRLSLCWHVDMSSGGRAQTFELRMESEGWKAEVFAITRTRARKFKPKITATSQIRRLLLRHAQRGGRAYHPDPFAQYLFTYHGRKSGGKLFRHRISQRATR